MDPLVSTAWLADNLDREDVRVLDATWFITGRDAAAEFEAEHIPGARFLDLGAFADPAQRAPMMLPQAERFERLIGALGVTETDTVAIYDNSPLKTSARAWWMLHRVFGWRDVTIVDGGLARWIAESKPMESGKSRLEPRSVVATKTDPAVRDLAAMRRNLETRAAQVIDARGAGRFVGSEAEPRPEIAAGHIPGSVNLPYGRLFEEDGTYKRGAALVAAFEAAGIDLDRPTIATCGSGVTAAVLVFAAHLLGKDMALYDGSWSEWGADPTTPKEAGA